jgi:hypothetical protein
MNTISESDNPDTSKNRSYKPRIKRCSRGRSPNLDLLSWVKQTSQEMRDPLSIMIVNLYMLKRSDNPEVSRRYHANLEHAVNRICSVIDKLAAVDQANFGG